MTASSNANFNPSKKVKVDSEINLTGFFLANQISLFIDKGFFFGQNLQNSKKIQKKVTLMHGTSVI